MIDLQGKAVIVTGGSRGIGRATCLLFAAAGAKVVLSYRRDRASAAEVVEKIAQGGGKALAVQGNMARKQDCCRLFDAALEHMGKLDVVVVNAGIWKKAAIDEMTLSQWHEMTAANLDSVFHSCRLAARLMKPRKTGKIILVSSTAGVRGEAYHSHYAATKGAMIAMTRSLAAELGYYNINVNCVAPGWVRTDLTASVFHDETFRNTVQQSIPLRRFAAPKDIAGPILFLASDLAKHIQGDVINVNGGSVLCSA